MARKTAKRTVLLKYAAPEDESVHATEGPSALGTNEPQQEAEKITIPQDGEVHLQNSNILPDSLSINELKTGTEFTASDDQTFGPGKYFFMPEEGTVFFDPSDAGRRVQIEYLWREVAEDESESDSSDEEDDEADLGDDEDEEKGEKKTRTKSSPEDSLWHLDSEWFKWKPLTKKITVNNALQAKLDKGVDLRRGLKVTNEKTGKELRVALSGADKSGNPKRSPGPGEVVYNYGNGHLYWGDQAAAGNTYVVEYYMRGQQGEKLTMAGEENEEKEYQLLESFKSRAENLWTNLLDNPDPEFVRDTLLPVIEDEIESLKEKALDQNSEVQKEQDLKSIPDLTGEFMELEQLLARREEDNSEEARSTARDFIESDISPKLSRFYSLASLLSERVYDMQTSAEKDEDFPDFGTSGARALDLPTLKYLKKVRQEANKLDEDLVDFSKYYTGQLIQWILDPDTYYPSSSPSKKKNGKDPRWEGIKRVFEQAGVGLADLQSVALEAFRRALLEFDRDKRDKAAIPDPKKFRVFANPLIKRRVQNALKRLFDKYQREQTVESTSRSGTKTVTIPSDGKEVDLGVPGLRVEDLQIKNKAGDLFTSANGVLLPTEAEKRKSPRVKILLNRRHNPSAQISVTNPETGEKLKPLHSDKFSTELKQKVADDPSVFYFATSSGTIWLSGKYGGKKLLVEAPGLSGDGGAIGKNQYRAHPTRGTIEFSPQNAGETVDISYSQTIRSKRHVSPMIQTDGEDGEEASLIDMKEDEGADPQSQAENAASQENVDKLLDVIGEILTVEEDPRLSDEDRAILSGLLGIGEPNGQRLTIQEIATREPFNVDISDSNKLNQVKTKRQKAANTLLEILREKAEDDPGLRKMVRPLESVLMGKDSGGSFDTDKFLGYLLKAPEDKGRPFQNVLVGVLGKSGLKQDEENILRWMWALPGNLRRDHDAEDKKYDALPNGLGPAQNPGARLQEIAIDEFGIEADDDGNISPAATGVVNKVYARALDKFAERFNAIYEGRKDFFKEKFPEFVQYYDRQMGKQNLRDELAQAEQTDSPAPVQKTKGKPEKAEPLYDQLKKSISGVDESMLRSLMEELVAANKKGGSINDLIKERQADIDSIAAKGADFLEKKTKDLRAEIEALKKATGQTQGQLENIKEEWQDASKQRNVLRDQALAESDDETRKAVDDRVKEIRIMSEILAAVNGGSVHDLLSAKNIKGLTDPKEKELYETFSYLRDADGDDLTDAKDDLASEIKDKKSELEELRRKVVSLANEEVRKSLRQLKQKVEDLKSRNEKFKKLLVEQQAAEDSKRDELKKQIGPLQKKVEEHLRDHNSAKELQALEKVRNYLADRDELQRGDGSYAIENMFEVPKPEKGKGYKAPKLAPGEEDTYQPLPRPEMGPASVVEKKPSGLPEPGGVETARPPKGKKPSGQTPSPAAEEERSKFTPPSKKAPAETQRSLFDELRAAAIPIDPEETKKSYHDRVENFRVLMNALRAHFADGKSIKDFKPKLSSSQTLPDQNKVLRAVAEYLRDYGGDLKKGPGVWDLKNLFNPTIIKPVESLDQKKPDLSSEDSAIESLVNAQPSLQNNKVSARVLHQTMERINKGESLKKILKGLIGESRNVAMRLVYFMSLHENLKKEDGKWDWSSLYSGKNKFPSFEEFDRSRPIENQMGPLVKGIQRQLQDEAGEGGGIESASNTEQRVSDMLHQMSELALHGMTLDQMDDHFEKEDKRGARPYSLAYLYQQVKNYLSRLNRTKGLSNSRNDMGLGKLFGPGAPAGTPTEQDEVKQAPKAEQDQLTPSDDRTTGFRRMVQVLGLDEKEAAIVHRIVQSLQLRMEDGTLAAELLSNLIKRNPKFEALISKLLVYLGKNRDQFESGVAGIPNLSSLTGMPFKHPAAETPEAEPEKPAVDQVPSVKEILKEKVEPVTGDERTKLRKSIFEDFATEHELDDDQKNLFADALRLLKEHAIAGSMADEGAIGAINRLVTKTKGTQLEGIFELLTEFFHEKGLVTTSGLPDFRGVTVPALGGRESFFKKDGTPNMKKVEEEDVSAEMPEPNTEVEEQAEGLADELGGNRGRLSPDLQDAVDFLKSDQVVTDEGAPRDSAKERLKKNIWDMMVQEFDFDEEEQKNAAEILEAIQKEGLPKIKSKLKGKGHAEVLLDDLIDYIKEQGLSEADIPLIQLPEIDSGEDSKDPVGLSIEDLMDDKPKGSKEAPNRLPPTTRKEVDEATVEKTLEAAKKAQGKGLIANMFDVADVVRGLEGKVSPEDAKNALLQAMDQKLIELRPESGRNSLSEADGKFVPVAADGVPLSTGRILKMPEPKAAPEPVGAPASEEKGTRGRLPAELTDRAMDPKQFGFVAQHAKVTPEDLQVLKKEMPGIEKMTYRKVVTDFKKKSLTDAAKGAITKYLKGLTAYLRLIQQGKDPLAKPEVMPTIEAPREKDEWRKDAPTENQIRKLRELSDALKALGQKVQVNLEPKSKGEASDAINSMKAALQQAQQTPAAPPAAKKPAPAAPAAPQKPPAAPADPAARTERAQLQKLLEKALEWSTTHDVPSAQGFKLLLKKKRPELLPLYEKIMPQVQKALDALHGGELDFDLSGI